jgi:subtilisin family serine protease
VQTFFTRSSAYNDPYNDLQRGFLQMQVAEAQRWANGDGIKVALIDTGVDTEHLDLRGRIAQADNFVDADAARFRGDRHGTEMAGVIAAVANNHEGIVGVAPSARLIVLKACWQMRPEVDAARCNSFTLARALVAALDAHAQVVNLSLTGPEDPLLTQLIREGIRRGVLFVGAAAPEGPAETASLLHRTGVIEVAASRSPPSQGPALHAPGNDILTLLPGGTYDFATGDSIATAQVTGIVALMLQRNPHLSIAQAGELLRASSQAPGNAETQVPQVNACAALGALLGRGDCH